MDYGLIFKIVISNFLLLFIPGFIFSYLLFPKKIDYIERMMISIALSFSLVALLIFYMNKVARISITPFTSSVAISLLCIFGLILIIGRKWRNEQ